MGRMFDLQLYKFGGVEGNLDDGKVSRACVESKYLYHWLM